MAIAQGAATAAPAATSLRARLGPPIGPREAGSAAPDTQLP
jgi:hypothetical protein